MLQVYRGFHSVFAAMASKASPVGERSELRLANSLSLSVAFAWDAPQILKVWLTYPQALFLSSLSSLEWFH